MMSTYRQLKQQQGLESLTVLDDKGFTIYSSLPKKQISSQHNYYELYQLSQYFYPTEPQQHTIIGIQTTEHITMLKSQKNQHNEDRIIIMREKITQNETI